MATFKLELGFDWNSKAKLFPTGFAQLQLCLTEALGPDSGRMASFYGEIRQQDLLEVSIVDITAEPSLSLELVTAYLIFSGAERSETNIASPLATRYLAGAAVGLSETLSRVDNHAYNVENAPTWQLGQDLVVNEGTFAFSASILVYEWETGILRTFIVDPEMQVGPFDMT